MTFLEHLGESRRRLLAGGPQRLHRQGAEHVRLAIRRAQAQRDRQAAVIRSGPRPLGRQRFELRRAPTR